ncbi:MAG: ribulose-phosphate 3-epimerase [Bacteroidia bacterium]|nr:MAG: ribulose-phosphate 3-epimerase [Bacteroidia bacterium]
MKRIIAPSLLSANFAHLGEAVSLIHGSRADWVHLDIMDGVFVPNISFGFPVIKSLRPLTQKTFDAHLMIVDPDRYLDRFAELGINVLTVHHEACHHLHRTLSRIRELGMKAGVALNPHTPPELLRDVLPDLDMVLIMSVNPGFGGQEFIPASLGRIVRLRQLAQEVNPQLLIQVDGGVTTQNAGQLWAAGADVLVAGSAVFSAPNPTDAIDDLLDAPACPEPPV